MKSSAILVVFSLIIFSSLTLRTSSADSPDNGVLVNFNNLLAGAASLERGDLKSNLVALTFDGAWLCEATVPILDALKKKNVRATFFITGVYIERYPELVKRMVAEGHEIGNHTYNHPRLTGSGGRTRIGKRQFTDELNRTHQAFFKVTGQRFSPYWRAPYGAHNQEVRRWAAELGYVHVGWTNGRTGSLDTRDWIGNPRQSGYLSADQIARKIIDYDRGVPGGASGAIVLMHLGSTRHGDFPHDKIEVIIDAMRSKCYEFVTISDLIGRFT